MNFEFTGNQIFNFWKKVLVGGSNDCWNWKATLNNKGYGDYTAGYKKYKAHRFSWMLTVGAIPEGLLVCHKCDNRKCCNPYHLFLGTNSDNMQDMVKKGRAWMPKGEKNPSAKLDESKITRVRYLHKEGFTYLEIGKMFGVSKKTIGMAVRRESWK